MHLRIVFPIGLCILILVAGAVIVFRPHTSDVKQVAESASAIAATTTAIFAPYPAQIAATTTAPQIPAGYVEYKNDQYHFSLLFPGNLKEKSFDDGGGAATITFQNVAAAQGFQIFVAPYTGTAVSDQRFKRDEPSGVHDNVTSVSIDGVVGDAFYSEYASLGQTREVWFIHGGYLYELTTLKPLDVWLTPILQTWRFI